MKKTPTSLLQRLTAGLGAFGILLTVLLGVVAVTLPAPVAAQAVAYEWVNAGTIRQGDKVFYDSDPTDQNLQFIAYGSTTCTYQNKVDVPMERLVLDASPFGASASSGATYYKISEAPADRTPAGQLKCNAPAVDIDITNPSAGRMLLYRSGDTIYSYSNATNFTKTNTVGNTEVFALAGQQAVQCPDLLTKDGSGRWRIFPMTDRLDDDNHDDAISESFRNLGFPDGDSLCRVASKEIETRMRLSTRLKGNQRNLCSAPCEAGERKDEPSGNTGWALTGEGNRLYAYQQFVPEADNNFWLNFPMGTADNAPPANAPPPGTPGGAGSLEEASACSYAFSVGSALSLKWLVCPIVNMIMSALGALENFLTNLLIINTEPLQSGKPFHAIWSSFRSLALGIIVILALFMVFAQALGIEAISAYMIRAVLAKLGIAVVLIIISFPLLRELVGIVNDFIGGMRAVVYGPFNGMLPTDELTGTASIFLFLLAGGGLVFLGPLGILSFAGSALAGVGITALIIVFAHSLIYLIIMLSPLLIALWAHPLTKKVPDVAANAFMSLCTGLILSAFAMASLRVLSLSTASLSGGGISQTVYDIIALIELGIIPFVLAFIFLKIGGLIGTITGSINDRSKGALDTMRNFRSKRAKGNLEKMSAGDRFKGNNKVSKAFNKTTRGAGAFATSENKSGMLNVFNRDARSAAWKTAIEQHDSINAARFADSAKGKVTQHNDLINEAMTYDNESDARAGMLRNGHSAAEIQTGIQGAYSAGGFGFRYKSNAVRRLAASGTGFKDLKQLHEAVARASEGNADLAASMLGEINASTKGAGRFDLATGFGQQMKIHAAQNTLNTARQQLQGGHITQADFDAVQRQYDSTIQEGYIEAIKGTDAVSMLRSKTQALDNVMPAMVDALRSARANGDLVEAGRLAGIIESYQQNSAYAAPKNIAAVDEKGVAPSAPEREQIKQEATKNATQVVAGPNGPMVVPVYAKDLSGNYLVDSSGKPIAIPRPGYDGDTAAGYNQQRPRSPYDPNDPRNS